MTYKPVLFAALLKHHGQLGPAEIPPKRDWTYRQVQWLAHSPGARAATCPPRTRSTRWACCAWRWPADASRHSPTAMCAKPCFAMSGVAVPMQRTPAACTP